MMDRHQSNYGINRVLPWIIPAVLVAGWFGVAEYRLLPAYLLPHPGEILTTGYAYIFGNPHDGMYAGPFLTDTGASLVRVLVGFAVAAGLGIPLGVMSGRLAPVERLLSTTVNGIRAVIMAARMVGRIDIIIVGIIMIATIGRLSDQLLTAGMKLCFKSARRSA